MTTQNELTQLRRERLRAWLDRYSISASEFARRAEVSRAYVNLIFKSDRHFGEKAARKFEVALGMEKGHLDGDDPVSQAVVQWEVPADLSEDEYAVVPRMAISLSAGSGALVTQEQRLPPLAFRKDWLIRQAVTGKNNLRILEVRGDSMEDYLQDGDVVLIDVGQTSVQEKQVYAIRYGDELRIKRLSLTLQGGLLVQSDNPKYGTETLSKADAKHIAVVGKLIWRGG